MAKNKQTTESTQRAREDSERTLKEQASMKPDPNQDTADAIKEGATSDQIEAVDQPDGPAAAAAREVEAHNNQKSYVTRDGANKDSKSDPR
jgi:hypothetical protein